MKQVQIIFDPVAHKYTDNEGNKYTSVTQKLDKYKKKYDSEFWAMYRALDQMKYKLRPDTTKRIIWVDNGKDKKGWYGLPELYAGIFQTVKTPVQIKAEWSEVTEQSLVRGNNKHNFLEDCVNEFYSKGETINSSIAPTDYDFKDSLFVIRSSSDIHFSPLALVEPEIHAVLVDLLNSGYTLYAEKRVYSYDHKISGTIDILAVNANGDFWIVDWKTNKDELQFEAGYYKKAWDKGRNAKVKTDEFIKTDDRLLYPLNHLYECKGSMYSLQLSLYAYICELWGLKCKGLLLCHIRPMVDKYNEEVLGIDGKVKFYPPDFYQIQYLKDDIHTIVNHN